MHRSSLPPLPSPYRTRHATVSAVSDVFILGFSRCCVGCTTRSGDLVTHRHTAGQRGEGGEGGGGGKRGRWDSVSESRDDSVMCRISMNCERVRECSLCSLCGVRPSCSSCVLSVSRPRLFASGGRARNLWHARLGDGETQSGLTYLFGQLLFCVPIQLFAYQ